MKPLRVIQFTAWSLAVIAAIAMAALYFTQQNRAVLSGPTVAAGDGVSTLGKAPFSLVDTKGQTFDNNTLRGTPTALFFGFTHCPDVCPTTLAEIEGWYETLGDKAATLRTYLVTVDPERDTPEVLAEYLSWTSRVTGVTGTLEQVQALARSWGAFFEKVPLEEGSYDMEHTAAVYLIDANGEFQSLISYQEDRATALQKLEALLAL